MKKQSHFRPFYVAGVLSLVVFLVSLGLTPALTSCVAQHTLQQTADDQPKSELPDSTASATASPTTEPVELRVEPGYFFWKPGENVKAKGIKLKIGRGAQVTFTQGNNNQVRQAQQHIDKNKGTAALSTDASMANAVGPGGDIQAAQGDNAQLHQANNPPPKPATFFSGLLARLKAVGLYTLALVGGLLALVLFLFIFLWRRKRAAVAAAVQSVL